MDEKIKIEYLEFLDALIEYIKRNRSNEYVCRWSKTIDDVFEIFLIKDHHGEQIIEFKVEK